MSVVNKAELFELALREYMQSMLKGMQLIQPAGSIETMIIARDKFIDAINDLIPKDTDA